MSNLRSALVVFRDKVNEDDRLRNMNRDWNRVISILPTDGAEGVTVRYANGRMEFEDGVGTVADIVLTAPSGVLIDLFEGKTSPTEPYLEGTLAIRGSQEDVLRLDFLSLMIWGE